MDPVGKKYSSLKNLPQNFCRICNILAKSKKNTAAIDDENNSVRIYIEWKEKRKKNKRKIEKIENVRMLNKMSFIKTSFDTQETNTTCY